MRRARCSDQRASLRRLSLDWLRAVHARAPPRRTRTRRALVVGARRGEGMRTPCRRQRAPRQDRCGMSEIPRIAPLASLPLFHKLAGRTAVVIGESEAASWKAELLTAAGAGVVRPRGDWTAGQLQRAAEAGAGLSHRQEGLCLVEGGHAGG